MNTSTLKLIGIIAMLLDHIGCIFFQDIYVFQIIGSLAVPIFCYFIAEGYYKTRDVKKYLLRIVGLAIISQIPFIMTFRLAFGETISMLNTIFDLALGLVAIWLYDMAKFKGKFIIIMIAALIGIFAGIDGDYYIVLLIYIFYRYHNNFGKMALWMSVLTGISIFFWPAYGMFYGVTHGISLGNFIQGMTTPEYIEAVSVYLEQIFYLLALIPIKLYNGERGRNVKLLFYGFYPLHLIVLYAIKMFL